MTSEPAPPELQPESVARSASVVSGAVMGSRVLGLAREAIFAAIFATTKVADAYFFAFRIPNLLRDFFAEGALASAFVPTFAEVREKQGEQRAFMLARRVLGTLATYAALVALLGIVFAPFVVSIVAPQAPADMRPHTILLTRIMFPFLVVVALAAVAMGILNTYRRYFVPAIAPAAFNVVLVVGGIALLVFGGDAKTSLTWWAGLVVVGGLAQLLVQIPSLRRIGFRGWPSVDLKFSDPYVRQVVRRMGPIVLSVAATNIMLVITTALASREEGWASSLSYAFRLVHLPIGIIGVALGTVLLAAGSRKSATDDHAGLDELIRRGVRLNWFLALPAAVGLFTLSEPIVRLIYERGTFDQSSTLQVARVLRWYAGGIVCYAGIKAAAPHFLSRGDTKTPMLCSLVGIAVNLVVALTLIGSLGVAALALAVAAGASANYVLLRALGSRRYGSASSPGWTFLAKCGLAAGLMGVGGWAIATYVLDAERVESGLVLGLLTLAFAALLALIYFVIGALLGIPEARALGSRWRRRQPI